MYLVAFQSYLTANSLFKQFSRKKGQRIYSLQLYKYEDLLLFFVIYCKDYTRLKMLAGLWEIIKKINNKFELAD